jgi:alginate O-acetyltransferase complex protein AlgI
VVFSSPIFLFGFLPIVLLVYFLSPKELKNTVLLVMSLFFYAWGELFYVGVMIVSILSNYVIGRLIHGSLEDKETPPRATVYLAIGILINIGLLISFKYANFIADNINKALILFDVSTIDLDPIHLPLGISFFTFQALSYVVDVYRREVRAQRSICHLALYISLFSQLISGPILRYRDVSSQLVERRHSLTLFSSGVQRFIMGLAKKMLIANQLGEVADSVFSLSEPGLTMPLAWIGSLAYTLQIYFDFSGYSDMAIGLGRMFGFRFLENFNYPYIARSLREFWRRWHISLSAWFRDYVYILLGGSRVSTLRVYVNLLVVFVLVGIWHGASWNFLVWGLFHGFFLASERMGFSWVLSKLWRPLQHAYVMLAVIVSWVFFRAETVSKAIDYLGAMINLSNWQTTPFQFAQAVSNESILVFALGIVLSLPVYTWFKSHLNMMPGKDSPGFLWLVDIPKVVCLSGLLMLSVLKVAASTYNPFIYFRF